MEEAIKKAEILIEALQYIKKFQDKIVVIKYGGSAIGDREKRLSVLEDIIFMNLAGMKPVLVHGGGPAINKEMEKLGKKPEFVKGFRVTKKENIDIIDKVLSKVNAQVVRDINGLGGSAKGMLGRNDIVRVKKFNKFGDIGFVGDITSINIHKILKELEKDNIPVITPLGLGKDGNYYNVNADQVAASIAVALQAEKLALLTNVPGVLKNNELVHTLTVPQAKTFIKKGIIYGGMIPKIKACITAVSGGANKAHIINGNLKHALLLEIFTDKGIGTELV